ncbi:Kae1-associated serine/threonine protein kinase [Candidatus Woesearchaeota archaeon]|nr:Kae1-associated serine/threonine protein kinase [Candidatus Woesearchaeota archaeon]
MKLAQGAEAIIYSDGDSIVKDRFAKSYRHPELDRRLRKSRTRREGKILTKLAEAQIPAPQLKVMDDKEMKVEMEHVPGDTVKILIDSLEKSGKEDEIKRICTEIGGLLGQMHNAGIIHHDLTTSNMIWHAEHKRVVLIDFGLSFFSEKLEDKAVDLHLLKHALDSRHHRIGSTCFFAVSDGYRSVARDAEDVFKRFEKVEERGRNKAKH